MTSPYSSKSIVRFTHTDPASFVFFPRHFEIIQVAVEDWFTEALGVPYADIINNRQIGIPTAKTDCEFFHPSRLGDTIETAVYVDRLGKSSLALTFIGCVDGQERQRAHSVLVAISLENGTPVPFPDDIREKIEAYQRRQGDLPAPKSTR